MPIPLAVMLGIAGASALGGLFGNRKKTSTATQESTSNTDETSTQNVDLSNMPQYTPEMEYIRDYILSTLMNRIKTPTDLTGYTTQGLRGINAAAGLKRNILDNLFAARGLNYSPTAANAIGRVEGGRIDEMTNFLAGIPLLQRQLQTENLSGLSDFFSRLPVGNRQLGTTTVHRIGTTKSTETGTQTDPGNMLGGLFSGLGTGLATVAGLKYGYGGGNQQPQQLPFGYPSTPTIPIFDYRK